MEELGIVGVNLVGSSGVFLGNIIGGFPLVDIVFILVIVPVVVIHSSANLEVSDFDSLSESAKIRELEVLSLQQIKDFSGLWVLDLDDFRFWLPHANGSIANGASVVERLVGPVAVQEHKIWYDYTTQL